MFSSHWNHSQKRLWGSDTFTPLMQDWVDVCVHVLNKEDIKHTFIKLCPLSLFFLWLKDVSLLIDINTHLHIHTVHQEGYRCLFRLSGRWACTLWLRSKGPSWHEHLPHATSSAVSQCKKTYIVAPRTGEDDAAGLLWSLFSLWGPEDELLVRIYVPQWITVLWLKPLLQRCDFFFSSLRNAEELCL